MPSPALLARRSGLLVPAGGGGELTLVRQDDTLASDPLPLWGELLAQDSTRHTHFTSGGPDDGPFRRLNVVEGDNVDGERAQLGRNETRYGLAYAANQNGTFFIFREGERWKVTVIFRVPVGWDPPGAGIQVMQIKQSQPATAAGGTPAMTLIASDTTLDLYTNNVDNTALVLRESLALDPGAWQEASVDILFSPDDLTGEIAFSLDGNDAPLFTGHTMKVEPTQSDWYLAGEPIRSALYIGPYPDAGGFHVDYGDVKVEGDPLPVVGPEDSPVHSVASAVITNAGGNYADAINLREADGQLSTCSTTGSGVQVRVGAFGFDQLIPEGATIDSVKAIWRARLSPAGENARTEVIVVVNDSFEGGFHTQAHADTSFVVAEKDITSVKTWSRADLLDGVFALQGRSIKNSGASATFDWDYIAAEVAYTE